MSTPTNNHVRQYAEGLRLQAGETRHGSDPQWGAPIAIPEPEFVGSRAWLQLLNRLWYLDHHTGGVTTPTPPQ